MKTIIFSFVLTLSLLPFCLQAQQKKQVQKQNTTTAPTENWIKTNQSERTAPCPYAHCDQVIQQTIAYYQPLANQTGQAVWTCVACCMSGYIVYATVVIEPVKPQVAVRVSDFDQIK